MKKLKAIDYVLIVFFILLIIGFVLALQFYKSEGNKCTSDPLGYAQKLGGEDYVCSCFKGWHAYPYSEEDPTASP